MTDIEVLKKSLIDAINNENDDEIISLINIIISTRCQNYENLYIRLAETYFKKGMYEECIASTVKYNLLKPDSLEGIKKISHNFLTDRRRIPHQTAVRFFDICKSWISRQIEEDPEDLMTRINTALMYMKGGQSSLAIPLLESIIISTTNENLINQLTHFLIDAKLTSDPSEDTIILSENIVENYPILPFISQMSSVYTQINPYHERAFFAKREMCKMISKSKNKIFKTGWDDSQICEKGDGYIIAHLQDVYIEGTTSILFDDTYVYGFNREYVPDLDKGDWDIAKNYILVEEPVIHFFVTNYQNYYHFLMESLCRLIPAIEYISKKDDFKIIIPRLQNNFQKEFLEILHISPQNIYEIDTETNIKYKFSNLHVVDVDLLHGMDDIPHSIWDFYVSPENLQTKLRNILHKAIDKTQIPRGTIVYIKRKSPPRIVENEKILIEKIREMYTDKFVVFEGTEPIKEQIQIFYNASIIFGPHGAGFANMLFCEEGVRVIEFPLKNNVNRSYEIHSKMLGHNYERATIYSSYMGNYTCKEKDVENLLNMFRETM